MCGRFTLTSDPVSLHAEFGIRDLPFDYRPRYNIAPTQSVLGLIAADHGWAVAEFFWGAVPGGARGGSHINARGETVSTKPSFCAAFRNRRCLILSDGFFEWMQVGERRVPMYIRRADGRPFAFAGLWEEAVQSDGTSAFTCTIITTEPNDLMRPIHDRMPVILPRRGYDLWLAANSPPDVLQELLIPAESAAFEAFAVSTLVNSPRNDLPDCITPAPPDVAPPLTLFDL